MVIPLCKAGYLRVTHPFATTYRSKSFHLHVLGMPPALILSQDQTLLILLHQVPVGTFFVLSLLKLTLLFTFNFNSFFYLILFSFQKSFRA